MKIRQALFVSLLMLATTMLAAQSGQPPQNMTPGKAFLMQADQNKDGKVSLEEFMSGPNQQFKAMDQDGDGAISEQEADVFAQAMHKRMQEMQQNSGATQQR